MRKVQVGVLALVCFTFGTFFGPDVVEAAAKIQEVVVRNTPSEPVPVSGNVGITGTPSVNVANTTPVPVAAQGVTNVAGTVQVSNLADPEGLRQPIRFSLSDANATDGSDTFTVPEGKRLVVEHLSVFSSNPATPMWELIIWDRGSGQGSGSMWFVGEPVPGCSPNCYSLSEAVHFYVDQGDELQRHDLIAGGVLKVTGYLITMP